MNIKYLQAASAAFLTEPLPDNFLELSGEDREEILISTAWEAVERYDADELYSLIDAHAYTIKEFVEKTLENN